MNSVGHDKDAPPSAKSCVEIIAEAGVNHNGSVERAMAMVEAAAKAGADVIKFQTFNTAALVNNDAPLADYQRGSLGSVGNQQQLLQQLELPLPVYNDLLAACRLYGIEFMSSPFDRQSLRFLVNDLGLERLKIASGEITNGPLLLDFAQSGCRLIVSTGMATMEEIQQALEVLAFGLFARQRQPSDLEECAKIFQSPEAQQALRKNIVLLHCTSQYPAPYDQLELKAMRRIEEQWTLPVGYSDHSQGIHIPIAAAALGACCIEKHFTLDKSLPGPDHQASLDTQELATMVTEVKQVCAALGSGRKMPQACEENTRLVARKSVVAARKITEGEAFNSHNLQCRRPGSGLSPMHYWSLLQQSANRDYRDGETIRG